MKRTTNRIIIILAAALLILIAGLPANPVTAAAGKRSKAAAEQSLTFVLVHGAWVDASFGMKRQQRYGKWAIPCTLRNMPDTAVTARTLWLRISRSHSL